MTLTDRPPGEKLYTAAEMLEVVLAAYERGLIEGRIDAGREQWRAAADAFRAARIRAELDEMKRVARRGYEARGYPTGYEYRGGPVDWYTSLPAGSACAWLRRQGIRSGLELAGASR